jgi:transposase
LTSRASAHTLGCVAKREPSCRACGLPDRKALDAALVAGVSFGRVAERYGLSKTTIFRHKQHVTETIDATAERPDDVDPLDVASVLRWAAREAVRLGRLAEAAGDYGTAIRAVVSVRDGLQWVKSLPAPKPEEEEELTDEEALRRCEEIADALRQKLGAGGQPLAPG